MLPPDNQLVEAIKQGACSAIYEAFNRGASIDARDCHFHTVLEVAQRRERPDLGRILLEHGCDPNQIIGKRGEVLLHRTTRTGDVGFTRVLLEAGANPNAVSNIGQTPLHLAVRFRNEYITQYLLQSGADANLGNRKEETALHVATVMGEMRLIQLLLKHGANPLLTTVTGYTTLHTAAATGQAEALQNLLKVESQSGRDHNGDRLFERVRRAAELHGHDQTAAVVIAAEQTGRRYAKSPSFE